MYNNNNNINKWSHEIIIKYFSKCLTLVKTHQYATIICD
jgi:hypothetical protein